MKTQTIFLVSCVYLLCLDNAMAEANINNAQNIAIINTVKGNVNIVSSKEEIDKIVAIYSKQHQLDTEQIKSLTAAVTTLSQGKGIIGTESQINAAMNALAQGNTQLAKTLFENETQKVELAAKQGAEAYRNLGALAYLDNTQESLKAYRRATELDPDNAEGWNMLGLLLSRVGDLDEAIIAYNKVLILGNNHEIAWSYGNLGVVYYTRGELDKAIEFYQKGLAIQIKLGDKQGMAKKYGNLGNVYFTQNNLDKAAEFYQKSLSEKGGIANYISLGNVYAARHEFDKAIEFYQKYLVITQASPNKEDTSASYSNLGIVYEKRGELDKAIEFQQKSLTINKTLGIKEGMAHNYGNLGNVYKQKGNKAEAKRYYQMSIELYKQLGSPMAKKVQTALDKLN